MAFKHSISPITNNKYDIPEGGDSETLKSFIKENEGKKIVVVQGLGFVGTVMSLVVANSNKNEYAVIGIDQQDPNSYWKIGDINEGKLPLVSSDPKVEEYFNKTLQENNFFATFDPEAFSYADVIIVDINLDVVKKKDSNENITSYSVPLEGFKEAMQSIGNNCKEDALILIETTVPPGTCRKIIEPIITECLEKRDLSCKKYSLGHSYERVMPGPNYVDSIKNFYRVFSGIDERSADAVESFLRSIISTEQYPLTKLKSVESTEMAKVLENSYRAMNISFAIEWSRFAENAGVDLYEVVNAIRLRPTHANLMYPGIGVGGYCLTKDPIMASWASEELFNMSSGLQFSVKAVEENDRMPNYCYNFIKNLMSSGLLNLNRIGMLGVAYGPGIGDTRFSPVEGLYNQLCKISNEIYCHDPYVNYWHECKIDIETSLEKFFRNEYDTLIISTKHEDYTHSDLIYSYLDNLSKLPSIVDTVGLLNIKKLPKSYELNKNLHILGVG